MLRVIVITFVCVFLSACGSAEGQKEHKKENTKTSLGEASAQRVEVAKVKASKTALRLRLPGEVQGIRDALLASPTGGYIEQVRVNKGDEVKAGALLVRVDTATYQAELARAQAERDQAEADLKRAEQLKDTIPRADLEAAQTRFTAASAAFSNAQIRANRAVIRAPFSGVVADVDVERGEVASPGAPLVRLVQLNPVKITLSVPDRDVVALRKGMAVQALGDGSGEVFEGQISHIAPAANPKTRTFEVDVEVKNPSRKLLPGMIARVAVLETAQSEAIVLPQGVIVTKLDQNGVYVISEGKAQWRKLDLGRVIGDQILVDSGLEEGETVVVTGQRNLQDGDKVIIARRGTCCRNGRVVFGDES